MDLVFAKTSPKRSFSMTENERFGLVFTNTGSINSGTGRYVSKSHKGWHQTEVSNTVVSAKNFLFLKSKMALKKTCSYWRMHTSCTDFRKFSHPSQNHIRHQTVLSPTPSVVKIHIQCIYGAPMLTNGKRSKPKQLLCSILNKEERNIEKNKQFLRKPKFSRSKRYLIAQYT